MTVEEKESGPRAVLKTILLLLLVAFAATAIVFSLVVLFADLGKYKKVDSGQARGMFTLFAYNYIDEIHPTPSKPGSPWKVEDIQFQNDNFAVVEASNGAMRSKLEFIYVIEAPNVRVLKINDVSGRDLQDAQLTLIRYLDFLHKGEYGQASNLYGGSLSRLVPYGGGGANVEEGLEGYCAEVSREGSCLAFKILSSNQNTTTGAYSFVVNYIRPNGTVYELADGKTEFVLTVEHEDNGYIVLSLPFD